jgi:formate dehydrogenase major subunit
MSVSMNRRQFFRICGAGLGTSTLVALGMAPSVAHAEMRAYKIDRATETRNTCAYCSVGCGILMYSTGDKSKNVKSEVFHIEGDADHPVNRGTLCPKGAALLDMIHSPTRLKHPEVRRSGSDKWEPIGWGQALDEVAVLMKTDRDANFIAKNAEGATVNRWLSTGMLAASASSNETGYLTQKFVRSLGIIAIDNQARV